MRKEYFCDYFALRILSEDDWLELDNMKVIYTRNSFSPERISVRSLLGRVTNYHKEWFDKAKRNGVEVIWVPYDKEYTLEMMGDLSHVKSGKNSYSFRVIERARNDHDNESNLELLKEIFK